LAICAVAIEQISQTHSFADLEDFVTAGYVDVIDWGVEKLTALPGSDKQALPSLEQLEQSAGEDGEIGTNDTLQTGIEKDITDAPTDDDVPESGNDEEGEVVDA